MPFEVRLLTLRYCPQRCIIDDAPLLALTREYEVHRLREHFFVVHEVPHLLCVLRCRPRQRPPRDSAATSPSPRTETTPLPTPPLPQSAEEPNEGMSAEQRRMYETLRAWRNETARASGVPAYVVLTNRNVDALVHEQPSSLAALGAVRGIGKAKIERHGQAILALLRGESAPTPSKTKAAGPTTPATKATPKA